MEQWNLDVLYPSFEDESFQQDMEKLNDIFRELESIMSLPHTQENLELYLKCDNACTDLEEKLMSYVQLRMSVDTQDHQAIQYASKLEEMFANFTSNRTRLYQWIAQFDLSNMDSDYVKEHLYILKEIQECQKYMLSDKEEAVLSKMKMNGSSAWLKYKNQLISSMTIEMDGQNYSLTEILNMAYSHDASLRKKAYLKEIESYKNVEEGIASALNAIKGEAIQIAEMKGYSSVLNRTLIDSRMSQKTLDVLLKTMKSSLPIFEKYFQIKAKKLGYKNGLPWYDLYAPLLEVDMKYPYDKGSQFVVEQFHSFSTNLGDYAHQAIQKHWIDVFPRQGKVSGAFCQNLHCVKQSRFLLNYGEDFSDTITLAHELGHGFHGHCLDKETALNAQYPMPIAETASTFCETIVKKAALKNATKEQKIMILENELCDCAQVIVDIYSRFLFESRFIEQRKQGPLQVEDIKNLMLEAQKEAYGHGLDHQYLHPYMWTWKPHYYEVDYAFYNFPYAFGLLLAKGLYAMYQKEGVSFTKTYEQLLSLTGKMSLEDVCLSVGIDITSEDFWQASIDMIEEDLHLLEDLL